MTIAASSVISKVRSQLVDNGTTLHWTDVELLGYLSDAQRTIVALMPTAASRAYVLPLAIGARQPLGTNVHTLLSITSNCNTSGSVPGRAIRVVLREQMDAFDPDWRAGVQSATVKNYVYDPSDTAFYVYPPNDGTGHVQLVYSMVPPELAATTDILVIQDIYEGPLFDFVMYRAHMKDSDFAAGQSLASIYLSAFTGYMKVTSDQLLQVNPNLQLTPTNMGVEGTAK